MRASRNLQKLLRTLQIRNLEKTVLRMITRTIDLGSILKCIPYKRVDPDDFTSLDLRINSWGLFLLVTVLLCAHGMAQWISFFHYVPSHGLNAQSCVHLNLLIPYTCMIVFSLQQTVNPRASLDVQNEIQRSQKSFRKSWATHPVLVLLLAGMLWVLLMAPFLILGLYLLDPTAPFFVVTRFLNIASSTWGYGAVLFMIGALLESTLLFFTMLAIISVFQAFMIIQFAMNKWMDDLRTRTHELPIRTCYDWMYLDELYRRIQVFSVLSNCFTGSIIMPANAVLLVLASAGSLLVTLRLPGQLHPFICAFYATVAVFTVGGLLFGIFGQYSKVNRNACDCMKGIVDEGRKLRADWAWNVGDEDMIFVKTKSRALRSFGVEIGIFGFITLSTQIAMWDEIINYLLLFLSL